MAPTPPSENLKPLGQEVRRRPKPEPRAAQHGTVGLVHDVASHFNDEIRPDAQEVPVKGRVMRLAERETVRDDRLPLRMPVRQHVRASLLPGLPQSRLGWCAAMKADRAASRLLRGVHQLANRLEHGFERECPARC